MTINITSASVISEIMMKSQHEAKKIKDALDRYFTEAGTDKESEVKRCLLVADAQLRMLLNRYLETAAQSTVSAGVSVPETLAYALNLSERREANKAAQLPQMMRDYLVNASLAKFYATVSATDFASKRGEMTAALGADILRLLYTKQPPVL